MENWAAIPGYSGYYEVSDLGRVRSTEREVCQLSRCGKPYQRVMKSKLLSAVPGSKGKYLYVHLADKQKAHHSVHSLVLRAFVGEPLPDQEACHNDGNSHNNVLTNLRWDTHSSNEEDRQKHGTVPKGEVHSCAKLTNTQVAQIKADLAAYTGKHYGKCVAIAALHGVSSKYVGEISRGTKRKFA